MPGGGPAGGPPKPGTPMQLHMGGPGGPQKLTLPPPSQKPAAPPK